MKQKIGLKRHCIREKCIAECRPAVAFDKSHQKSETYKHHDVDILEDGVEVWNEGVCRVDDLNPDKESIEHKIDKLNDDQSDGELGLFPLDFILDTIHFTHHGW